MFFDFETFALLLLLTMMLMMMTTFLLRPRLLLLIDHEMIGANSNPEPSHHHLNGQINWMAFGKLNRIDDDHNVHVE